jgi:hypothetical protein
MPVQPPFRSDAFQVENADAPVGPRLIEASLLDGSLRVTDPRIPGGLNIAQLAGLQQAHNVIVVSQTGVAASKDAVGDPITTVQGGLDAVPTSADVNNPWTVVLAPGIYIENVLFIRDGVTLVGLGNVTLRPLGAFGTIRVRSGPASVPRRVRFQNLRIENSVASQACIDIDSSTFATGTITIASVPNIGDVATVNGVTLEAIAVGAVPAPGEFELGTTIAETAANLALAINDAVNGLTATLVATVVGAIITIRALDPGVAGNAITLASSVVLVIVVSGATLTGGTAGSPGSTVGNNLIEIIDCDLVATGLNGYQVRAAAVNNLSIRGGDWREGATGTFVDVRDCAFLSLVDQPYLKRLELHYDNTNPNLPSIGTSTYIVQQVNTTLPMNASLVGVGTLTVTDSTISGAVAWAGSSAARTWSSTRCRYGTVNVGGSGTITLSNCTHGALTGAGTGTLAETTTQGSLAFVASASETFTFDEPQPDATYTVLLEPSVSPIALTAIPFVDNKTAAGFDIVFGAAQTVTVEFVVKRDI